MRLLTSDYVYSVLRVCICLFVIYFFGWIYGFVGYALFIEFIGIVMYYVFDLEVLTPMDAIF
jgi:vacuolar-type H+-ATPase subunit I/STV1